MLPIAPSWNKLSRSPWASRAQASTPLFDHLHIAISVGCMSHSVPILIACDGKIADLLAATVKRDMDAAIFEIEIAAAP